MGNDGGVIAVQRKFMRHANPKAKSEKADAESIRIQKTQTCAISEQPLREPIVACALGNLYNKEALLEHLLARTIPEKFQHIASLKDVVTCRFTKQKDGAESAKQSAFYCPVSMIEFTGKHPFVVLGSCGCVISERSLKEVQSKDCLVCGQAMDETKIIHLLLPDDQYKEAQKRLLEQKAMEKLQRKEKKKNKDKQKKKGTADEEEVKAAKRADKKRKLSALMATDAASNGQSNKIAKDAASAILKEKEKSKVFASLFNKDKTEKKSANDLLMTVGGLRYTLS